jgi:protein phosphatase
MGGHAAGEIASQITASAVEEVISGMGPESNMEDLLRLAVQKANANVYETQRLKPECRGMGSTLTVLTFWENDYFVAQVGDSRAYLFRDRMLRQLTRDHSLVWPLYESGILTKDDISRHPQKNLITRSIGTQPQVEPDLQKGIALEGDIFLLCSDGLTDVLSDQEILQILSNNGSNPQTLSDLLVKAANSGGGPDNITTVVVHLASPKS